MCNLVYLSTTSDADLTEHNTNLLRFAPFASAPLASHAELMKYAHRWFVGSKTGCSCEFRHVMYANLGAGYPISGFAEPVEWNPEGADALEATRQLYHVLKWLMQTGGARVDLIDDFDDEGHADTAHKNCAFESVDVSLAHVPEKCFRMYERRRFEIFP